MITPFEATLLGIVAHKPISRYGVMKAIQQQSLYWAGSPGAVYSALGRMLEKGLIEVVENTDPKIYKITDLGLEVGHSYLKTPVPASKLILDPSLIRIKLRGIHDLPASDRIRFYEAQLEEYRQAKQLVHDKQLGFSGTEIVRELSTLALRQLGLEADFILKLLDRVRGESTSL